MHRGGPVGSVAPPFVVARPAMMTSATASLPVDTPVRLPRVERSAEPLAFTPALCTLCGVEDADPVAVGADFEYRTCPDEFLAVRCRRCGLVYLNPRPADAEARRIYPDDYHAFAFRPAEYGLVYRVRRRLEARRLLGWARHLPADARVLDVGCGDGFHLALLRDYGPPTWTLEGLDDDDRAVAAARANGLEVRGERLENAWLPPATFDLVLLLMTVEHLPDPAATMRLVAGLLAPGGRVVVVTDNTDSPDRRLFGGRHWGGYHFPRHTYLFDRATLTRLGELAGLTPVRVVTAVSPVNWVYSVRNWLDDWGGPRWLVNRFSLKSVPALAVFTLLDAAFTLVNRGAILHGTFAKPGAAK